MSTVDILLVGDRAHNVEAHHVAEERVRRHVGADATAVVRWAGTDDLADRSRARELLSSVAGIWLLPGSPYRSLAGAVNCVSLALEANLPFLGTCAGMQHAWLALGRERCGIPDAVHAEVSTTGNVVVTRMAQPLPDARLTVNHRGGLFRLLYRQQSSSEEFRCSFGPDSRWLSHFLAAGIAVEAVDPDDNVVAFSIPDHRYFVATLYQPELSPRPHHPVLASFLRAAAQRTLPPAPPAPQRPGANAEPTVHLIERPSGLPAAEASEINAELSRLLWRSFRGSNRGTWPESRAGWQGFFATPGGRVQDQARVALVYQGTRLVQCSSLRVLHPDPDTTVVWAALTATDPACQGQGMLARSMAALVDRAWAATFPGACYAVARTPNPVTYAALRDLVPFEPAWAAGFWPRIDDEGRAQPPPPDVKAFASRLAALLSPECSFDDDNFVIRGFLTRYGPLYAHRDPTTSRSEGVNAFFNRFDRDDGLLIFFRVR